MLTREVWIRFSVWSSYVDRKMQVLNNKKKTICRYALYSSIYTHSSMIQCGFIHSLKLPISSPARDLLYNVPLYMYVCTYYTCMTMSTYSVQPCIHTCSYIYMLVYVHTIVWVCVPAKDLRPCCPLSTWPPNMPPR